MATRKIRAPVAEEEDWQRASCACNARANKCESDMMEEADMCTGQVECA